MERGVNLALSTFMIQPGNVSASEGKSWARWRFSGKHHISNLEVTYHGLVTYNWDSRCESAESEISYSVLVNRTDPTNSALLYSMPAGDGFFTSNSSLQTPAPMTLYPNSTQFAGLGYDTSVGGFDVVPFGDTLYFMSGSYNNITSRFPEDKTGLTIDNQYDILGDKNAKCIAVSSVDNQQLYVGRKQHGKLHGTPR